MKCPKCGNQFPPIPIYALVEDDGKLQMPLEMSIECLKCGHEEKMICVYFSDEGCTKWPMSGCPISGPCIWKPIEREEKVGGEKR